MPKIKPLLIHNGHLIDPGRGVDEVGDLIITDGRITDAGTDLPSPGCDILDATGMIVCPGFIDLHCHLRQPGFENKETIATGTRAAAKGGFTTVCCMPNTNPPLDNKDYINYVKLTAELEGVVRVLPIGCISKGRKGEELVNMAELASEGAVGFSDDGSPVMDSRLMLKALEHSISLELPIIDHCEDTNLTRSGQVNDGKASEKLGLKGMPAVAEELMIARDLALARLTGGKLHIAHVSTAGSVELIRQAKDNGVNVTAEVTPHHLTLSEDIVRIFDTSSKVSPPLRSKKDIVTLIQGLKDGVIDIIATDHAPHAESDKLCDYTKAAFGISGLETAFGSLMTLVHSGKLDLKTIISRLTCDPARIIGTRFGKSGTLEIGAPADVAILDLDKEWVVDVKEFASKGKNTPLAGTTLKGKIMATLSTGKLVYQDDDIRLKNK